MENEETSTEESTAVVEEVAEEAVPAPVPVPALEPQRPREGEFVAVGRRKSSVARARLKLPGTGKITINGKEFDTVFNRPAHVDSIMEPLKLTGLEGEVDIRIIVNGGGISGQAGAIRHAISRTLLFVSPDFRGSLRRSGCLTRDPRAKERRKCGLKKARKAEQYSKR